MQVERSATLPTYAFDLALATYLTASLPYLCTRYCTKTLPTNVSTACFIYAHDRESYVQELFLLFKKNSQTRYDSAFMGKK